LGGKKMFAYFMNGVKRGIVKYRQSRYEYTIYYLPFSSETAKEVIQFFGNRYRDGKLCLDVDESYISENIQGNKSIAYIKVNEQGYDDYATASLKVINWCHHPTPQVFVMALCRSGSQKSQGSPVGALFKLSERIAHRLGEKYIYLFPQQGDGVQKLIEIYKGYGFMPTACHLPGEYPMRKRIHRSTKGSKRQSGGTRKKRRSSQIR
jgi:hypothetical protein